MKNCKKFPHPVFDGFKHLRMSWTRSPFLENVCVCVYVRLWSKFYGNHTLKTND